MSTTEKALQVLRYLPRVKISNLRDTPGSNYVTQSMLTRGPRLRPFWKKDGAKHHMSWPRLGFEGGQTPFYLKIPMENYNEKHFLRRQYPPMSLKQLQLLIDLGRVDITRPIDLADLCNTKLYFLDPRDRHFGVHLTSEGMDDFKAKVNIEVQHAREPVIAAIERNGGTITTAYFDIQSVTALMNPVKFFKEGRPIPKRQLPPEDAIRYYSDPEFRGYLADPQEVAKHRFLLAQKYGYELPDLESDPDREMLKERKDPRQVFYGLQPGWVVNLRDKVILRPTDPEYKEYYNI
ncbi:large ribosomal subunit protein uL15m [Dermacentor andersoni]|uniref:large ribosomal subunit protein uL15m n=1 Tax=Dermacentor andersoni TaxID=34620 RepID=UPI0021553FD4|nr:39S ribosomal protein L15, mitochondrial-like [Dermacentor andersoni]